MKPTTKTRIMQDWKNVDTSEKKPEHRLIEGAVFVMFVALLVVVVYLSYDWVLYPAYVY